MIRWKYENDCFAQCQGSSACLGNTYYHTLWKTCDCDMDSPWKADKEQTSFQAPEIRLSHLCHIAKGVWLEMADYLCWDTSWTCNCSILLNLTLYPLPSAPIQSKTSNLTTKSRSLTKVLLRH